MIYLITPTGNRPEGLALLGQYINAQTYSGNAEWVIVDDCDPASPIPETRFKTTVIRPDWRWNGNNTQARSMIAALDAIPEDATVFVLEDDDCYLPDYIETMVKALQSVDLVGENEARYYNVRTRRFKAMKTARHSSLASTAMNGTQALRQACENQHRHIDIHLWRYFTGRKILLATRNVIGIKGLPGRGGIGAGHKEKFGQRDMNNDILPKWAGDYAENYQ